MAVEVSEREQVGGGGLFHTNKQWGTDQGFRLDAGELNISGLILVGPALPSEPCVEGRVGSRLQLCFLMPPALLRLYSDPHVEADQLAKLVEAIPVKMPYRDDVRDLLISLHVVVQRAMSLPRLGFSLVAPIQLVAGDELYVRALPPGNRLFLTGVHLQNNRLP